MLINGIQQDLYKSCILAEKIHGISGKMFIIQYITLAPIKSFIKKENCCKKQIDQNQNIVEKTCTNYLYQNCHQTCDLKMGK